MVSSPAVTVPSHHVEYVPYVVTWRPLGMSRLVFLNLPLKLRQGGLRTKDSNVQWSHRPVHPRDATPLGMRSSTRPGTQGQGSTSKCFRERPGRRDSRTGQCCRIRLLGRATRSMAAFQTPHPFGNWTSSFSCSTMVAPRWSSKGLA